MRARTLFIGLILGLAVATPADARSRHEKVKIAPLKEGKKVVGVKVTLTLRNQDRYGQVRIGLAPAKGNSASNWRDKAALPSEGWLLHQWKARKGGSMGANEVTLSVKYADAPKLKPGEKIQVVTAWKTAYGYHIWGIKSPMNYSMTSFALPKATVAKKPPPKKKPTAKKPPPKKKPTAKKPPPKKKPTAKKPPPKKKPTAKKPPPKKKPTARKKPTPKKKPTAKKPAKSGAAANVRRTQSSPSRSRSTARTRGKKKPTASSAQSTRRARARGK